MPLVPIMPTSGENRCMLPPRPREQPVGTTVQLGDQFQRRHALGQSVAVAAVRAENHVLMPQMGAHAGGDRFLADVGVAGAVDQPALVRADQQLLAAADKRHRPVQGEQAIGGDSRIGFDGHRLGRS